LSTRRSASIGLRLLAAFIGIVGLEVVRAHPSLWLLIAGSIAFNSWFQWWTLPDTSLKALIAAVLSEAGLPPTARIVSKAVVALLTALAPLIAPR